MSKKHEEEIAYFKANAREFYEKFPDAYAKLYLTDDSIMAQDFSAKIGMDNAYLTLVCSYHNCKEPGEKSNMSIVDEFRKLLQGSGDFFVDPGKS